MWKRKEGRWGEPECIKQANRCLLELARDPQDGAAQGDTAGTAQEPLNAKIAELESQLSAMNAVQENLISKIAELHELAHQGITHGP